MHFIAWTLALLDSCIIKTGNQRYHNSANLEPTSAITNYDVINEDIMIAIVQSQVWPIYGYKPSSNATYYHLIGKEYYYYYVGYNVATCLHGTPIGNEPSLLQLQLMMQFTVLNEYCAILRGTGTIIRFEESCMCGH